VVGHQPDGLELLVVQQVGLVDDQDGGASSFGVLAGQDVPGLDGQGGGAVDRAPAQRGDRGGEDAPHPGGWVADVDDVVPGRVQAGDGGPDGGGLAKGIVRFFWLHFRDPKPRFRSLYPLFKRHADVT
jgi:hypothetical protein